jgi:hypothetical protein
MPLAMLNRVTPIDPAGGVVPLWPDPIPDATLGVAYSFFLTASGGTPPYIYSVWTGSLPAGISLNPSTGEVSGTPTATVSFQSVTFQVADIFG